MSEIIFIYEQEPIKIQCNKNQKMEDICKSLSSKINVNLNSLIFLYGGKKLNLEYKLNELTKEKSIKILVSKIDIENENENICSKCGKMINNKIISDILKLNNNINDTLKGIKIQIEHTMEDIKNKRDINYINIQLKNIIIIINNINDDLKKMNNDINKMNFNNDIKLNNDYMHFENMNSKINKSRFNNDIKSINNKNEIICIYNKKKDKINLLHNYDLDSKYISDEDKKLYKEGKNNINENNIDIYINGEKIKFDYKYKSKERGQIKVKFLFKNLLTSTSSMFRGCSSLKLTDLSTFNAINVNNMANMFEGCSSLKSVNLPSFNKTNIKNISYMFYNCSSLESIDLSSFNTTSVNNMSFMFHGCSSVKSINFSSFNTNKVNNMSYMFEGCSSLEYIDLSSFDATNTKNMSSMFSGCSALKKENVKISNYGKNILYELIKY